MPPEVQPLAGFTHDRSYSDSHGASPELPLREIGLGSTAPANLYHFVGHPAVALIAQGPGHAP